MAIDVIVLGDGTGGVIAANLLASKARKKGLQVNIKIIGKSPMQTYQPGLLFLPFQKSGYRKLADIQRNTAGFIGSGVDYIIQNIAS